MSRGVEHHLRVKAAAAGVRNPFCLCCGQMRERHGGTLCRECRDWAGRAVLRARRIQLRKTFALLDGGREVRA
jgi:hypothetical protein